MFLEERVTEKLLYGSSYSDELDDDVTETRGGNEHPVLYHPYPRLHYTINLLDAEDVILASAEDLYRRSGGRSGAFRVKHSREFSTNDGTGVPSSNDQMAVFTADGVYQITRWYGDETDTKATRRRVKKPVAGTVVVGIRDELNNPVEQVGGWSEDNTTGLVTFDANITGSITAISQAANAVIDIGAHTLTAGQTVHVSAVAGMIEINGLRGTILSVGASDITVDISTTLFTAYTSGGDVNTRPQENEVVTAGCEFDIPMRFDLPPRTSFASYMVESTSLTLVERRNP